MTAVILAAGKGTRCGALTESLPKCMLRFAGKPLIQHQVDVLSNHGISDIAVVKGYHGDKIIVQATKVYWNNDFTSTNMVASLFAAEAELAGDVIISYGDVVYDSAFLEAVLAFSRGDIGVAVDMEWRRYYEARFTDALSDAESLCMTPDMQITDIGRRTPVQDDIQGQYVGVLKLTREGCARLRAVYHHIRCCSAGTWRFRGRTLHQLYMTDLIQILIDSGVPVHAIPVRNGWLEFDSAEDLVRANHWWRTGRLAEFFRVVSSTGIIGDD
jgi:choline kinase